MAEHSEGSEWSTLETFNIHSETVKNSGPFSYLGKPKVRRESVENFILHFVAESLTELQSVLTAAEKDLS